MKSLSTLFTLAFSLLLLSCNIIFAQSDLPFIDGITRAQAYDAALKQSIINKKTKTGLETRSVAASYTAGFDATAFEGNIESNQCFEVYQISVSVVDAINQVGTFSNGIAGAGLGIDEGIILTTGDIAETFTDNDNVLVSIGTSDANAIADADLDQLDPGGQSTHNESILLLDFTVPPGLDGIRVPFQFSSDEYPEYVGTQFNDVFGFFISGPGISGVQNIALVPGTSTAIAVNSINGGAITNTNNATNYPAAGPVDLGNAQYFIDNTDGTNSGPIISEYDGYTTILYAEIAGLTPGETYQLKMGIADIADHYGDSAVFIGPMEGLYNGNAIVDCYCDIQDPNEDCDKDGIINSLDCDPEDAAINYSAGDVCTDSNGDTGLADANCICIANTSGTSSGSQGGLESNNRLSQKVAQRNYNRTVRPTEEDALKAQGKIPFKKNDNSQRSEGLDLSQLIPTNVWGAYIAESTPTDLLDITNAVEIISADYYLNDVRNAVVLAIESENGVYEHSKYICDRLDGASLLDISYTDIADYSFITYELETAGGLKEYAISFSGYEYEGTLQLENHWSLDKYAEVSQFYNFQIWASSIEKTKSLVISILKNIEDQTVINGMLTGTIPGSFVKNGYYENGNLHLNILNKGLLPNLEFKGVYRETESGEDLEYTTQVATNSTIEEELILETGYLYDMGLSMVIDADHSDELFIADGTWGIDDQNPNSQINDFTITPQVYEYDDNTYGIERGINLNASVKDYQNIYRSITPKWQSIDLSAYETLSLVAGGTGQVQITLVDPNQTDWNMQLSYTITLTDDLINYDISLNQFNNYTDNTQLENINTLVVSIIGDNQSFTDKTLVLQDINFNNNLVSTSTYELDATTTINVYPNPVVRQLTISNNSIENNIVSIQIFNTTGKTIMVSNAANYNQQVQLDLSNTQNGIYFLEIVKEDGTKIIKKIIKQ